MSIITSTPGQIQVIKRTGEIASFNAEKISVAIGKAFLAVEGQQGADSSRIHDRISQLTEMVMNTFKRRLPSGGTIHIEEIQDQVELALMRTGEQKVARAYVIYREQRATARQQTGAHHHPTGIARFSPGNIAHLAQCHRKHQAMPRRALPHAIEWFHH